MAGTSGHHATPGAWLSVLLLVAGFVVGTLALCTHLNALWIAGGVLLLIGIVAALASRMMEQAY